MHPGEAHVIAGLLNHKSIISWAARAAVNRWDRNFGLVHKASGVVLMLIVCDQAALLDYFRATLRLLGAHVHLIIVIIDVSTLEQPLITEHHTNVGRIDDDGF